MPIAPAAVLSSLLLAAATAPVPPELPPEDPPPAPQAPGPTDPPPAGETTTSGADGATDPSTQPAPQRPTSAPPPNAPAASPPVDGTEPGPPPGASTKPPQTSGRTVPVQRPKGAASAPSPRTGSAPPSDAPPAPAQPVGQTQGDRAEAGEPSAAPDGSEPKADAGARAQDETPEGKDEKPWQRPKAFKFFRIAFWPHIGYTNGTSQKNGIFDREKTIENAMMGGTGPVAGDPEQTRFGGFAYGGTLDLEVFLFNVWLDFRKFFRPGGMLSVLAGYDHEFWLHRRVRLDPGIGFGFMRIFLGGPLEDLYYSPDSPLDTNIATAGIEVRAMLHLLVRIWRPLYFGVSGMGGYHYLFTANVDEVSKEKGFHFGASLGFRVEFAVPRDPP